MGAISEHAITRRIDKQRRAQLECLFGAELNGLDRPDMRIIFQQDTMHVRVEIKADVLFAHDPFVEYQVPVAIHRAFDVSLMIARALFGVEFFVNAAFLDPGMKPAIVFGKQFDFAR